MCCKYKGNWGFIDTIFQVYAFPAPNGGSIDKHHTKIAKQNRKEEKKGKLFYDGKRIIRSAKNTKNSYVQ